MRFDDDHERAAFVEWADHAEEHMPQQVLEEVDTQREYLLENGWTQHGYLDDKWCPPDEYYDRFDGNCHTADDPTVIAGTWLCTCGAEFERLRWAEGHVRLAGEGAKLDRPGPHSMTELERLGPRHTEWGD